MSRRPRLQQFTQKLRALKLVGGYFSPCAIAQRGQQQEQPGCTNRRADTRILHNDLGHRLVAEDHLMRDWNVRSKQGPGSHSERLVYAFTGAGLAFSMPCVSMKRTTSCKPCPVFRLLNRKGLSARILRASRSMTSSDAPT